METRIYYLSADFDLQGKSVESFTEQELRLAVGAGKGVEVYSLQDFEAAFNGEWISDLGYVRIFTTNDLKQ